MLVVSQPGYTDAYYSTLVAERVAMGQGLTADFVWNFIEAQGSGDLPVPSHRFWMPLATLIAAAGIRLAGGIFGTFGSAQLAIVAVSAAIPVLAYVASRSLGGTHRAAMVTATLVGLGGLFAPAWVSTDSFAPAAVLGTAFFLLFRRAAAGDVRAGALAGLAVGVLYLARAEGALFGLPLLMLRTRAGFAGAAVALAFGVGWQLRQAFLGLPPDLFARAAFLDRYEDFFAVAPPTLERHLAAWPEPAIRDLEALVTNAITFILAFALVLVPGLVAGTRALWSRPEVRAYLSLAVTVYIVLSLAFTLHSTRGAYFHSLAAFFPFGVALAVVGSASLFVRRGDLARIGAAGALVGIALVSWSAIAEWDRGFNGPYRVRLAAVSALPAGRLLAMDAAAWRWITGRETVVTPADGLDAASCRLRRVDPRVLVLEPAHFSVYADQYRAGAARAERDGIRVYDYRSPCEVAGR